MKLTCPKCAAEILVPPEAQNPGGRVECPGCGAGFRLKPRPTGALTTPPPALTAAASDPDATIAGHRPPPKLHPGIFVPGELIAGRYRIERFLAVGGMGEVYAAEDLELRERVALKTIHPRISGDEGAIDRFKREIYLARKVSHPNICRIHDLGQHQSEPTGGLPLPPITFLTMELLEGETLATRLARRGRLATEEALPILRQLAAALDAAHAVQVVHRDLKSENVFLVEKDGVTRAVITDFGIARGAPADDRFAALVTGAGIVGTPAYMAPEQVEGGAITPATDLYSLGIVLYEMLTGQLPFTGDNPLTTAVKRLKEPPTPPHVHVPDVDLRWERAILRCLERKPENRFSSAGEVVVAVVPLAPATAALPRPPQVPAVPPAPKTSVAASASRRPPWKLAAVLALVLAMAGATLWWRQRGEPGVQAPRQVVAIFGFQNTTGRPEVAWLSTALAEMLGTELARGEGLRTVPGENVARARHELALVPSDSLSAESLGKLRALTGCDFVVMGSYVAVAAGEGLQIRLDLRLQDAALGETLEATAHSGTEAQLFDLVAAAGRELREHLGSATSPEDGAPSLPRNSRAARLYAEALESLRRGEPQGARDQLVEAVGLEPANALLHSALASAWRALGHAEHAAEEARRAFELSSELGREDRLAIEARYRESVGEWPAAITAWRSLWALYPDNLEYGLKLAAAATTAHLPEEALQTVEKLRRLPPPASLDPRIDLAEAAAAGFVSSFGLQAEAAQRAAQRAEEIGARWLLAQAKLTSAHALRFLGRLEPSETAAQAAYQLYGELGDRAGVAEAATALGNVAFDRGAAEQAQERFREALEISRQLGDQGAQASALNNLALVLKSRGELEQAQDLYQQAAAIFRDTGDRHGTANTVNNQGAIFFARDQLADARASFEQAVETWEALGDAGSAANGLNNLAVVLRLRGELTASREMHERALAARRKSGQKLAELASLGNLAAVLIDQGELAAAAAHLEPARTLAEQLGQPSARAQTLHWLGWLDLNRGRLENARRELELALELRRQLGERRALTETRLLFTRLLLAEGQAAAAEIEAELIALDCREDGRLSDEARAVLLRAAALAAQGRWGDAEKVASEARPLATASEQPSVGLELETLEARVNARRGEREDALATLAHVAAETERLGYLGLRLEALVTAAEIEHTPGRSETTASQSLQEAHAQAAAHGYGLLEQRAAKLLPEAI